VRQATKLLESQCWESYSASKLLVGERVARQVTAYVDGIFAPYVKSPCDKALKLLGESPLDIKQILITRQRAKARPGSTSLLLSLSTVHATFRRQRNGSSSRPWQILVVPL
jgi:hypothetical protein